MDEYDEIVADSEGDDEDMLIPGPAKSTRNSAITTASASVSANISSISDFTPDQTTAASDIISNFSSRPRPKPRPLPRTTTHKPSPSNDIEVLGTRDDDSISNFSTATISIHKPITHLSSSPKNVDASGLIQNIADRAKTRQRGNRNSSSSSIISEVIELDDDDELLLQPVKKVRRKPKTTLVVEPESSFPIPTSPLPPRSSILPPSDPPLSTPAEDFELPPIAILPNPASSATRTNQMDEDEEIPPAFFASDTSPSHTARATVGTLHMDSVLIPPQPALMEPKAAKKSRQKKKSAGDDGDEDEFVPGAKGKAKEKRTKQTKGKDKAQSKEKTNKSKAKAKSKEKITSTVASGSRAPEPPQRNVAPDMTTLPPISPGYKRGRSAPRDKDPEEGLNPRKKMRLSDIKVIGDTVDMDIESLFSQPKSRVPIQRKKEGESSGVDANMNIPLSTTSSSSATSKNKNKSVAKSKSKGRVKKGVDVPTPDTKADTVEFEDKTDDDINVKGNMFATPVVTPAAPVTPAPALKYPTLASRYTIAPKSARSTSTPMSELIRRVSSMPNSQFKSPVPAGKGKGKAVIGVAESEGNSNEASGSSGGLTAYSPYLKSSRTFLSRIAPLHPNRRNPPPLPPPPPPRKKTRKELEWEKKTAEEREELEEKWEEELIEFVGGRGEWTAVGEEADTVTVPTREMYSYALLASLGDDVYTEPSTLTLEAHVAKITGKEAGLFMVSGTMSNQIALRTHLKQPPFTVLCDHRAHIYKYEVGGAGFHSGAAVTPVIPSNGHHLTLQDVQDNVVYGPDVHFAPTEVIALENTLNGTIFPQEEIISISEFARSKGIKMHLDGARIWHVAAERGTSLKELVEPFDTVSLCFSKGLGAPIGSCLVGPKEFIARARRIRKLFGGGMRQTGILAGCAAYALTYNFPQLARVHQLTHKVQKSLEDIGVSILSPAETCMVFYDADSIGATYDEIAERGAALPEPLFLGGSRLVLHIQTTESAVDDFIKLIATIAEEKRKAGFVKSKVQGNGHRDVYVRRVH
ncbi:hypothetical protein D9757_006308 [Collybiopsis confluens]|uniref:Aromatic amino acid beta-eliminating lyase/threonine aldolase domain-containing protein n=1 Tax=Collybiopsis confluens TaxID=2823264 RepID=A0A8H5HGL7_9AGAR|nr:hypothetical protein D9757_006308 [Collybiopsis confluens]